jgi:hypothetical protein
MHGVRTDMILGFFEDGWKFANERYHLSLVPPFTDRSWHSCLFCHIPMLFLSMI